MTQQKPTTTEHGEPDGDLEHTSEPSTNVIAKSGSLCRTKSCDLKSRSSSDFSSDQSRVCNVTLCQIGQLYLLKRAHFHLFIQVPPAASMFSNPLRKRCTVTKAIHHKYLHPESFRKEVTFLLGITHTASKIVIILSFPRESLHVKSVIILTCTLVFNNILHVVDTEAFNLKCAFKRQPFEYVQKKMIRKI